MLRRRFRRSVRGEQVGCDHREEGASRNTAGPVVGPGEHDVDETFGRTVARVRMNTRLTREVRRTSRRRDTAAIIVFAERRTANQAP